jgi:hypothetical protein
VKISDRAGGFILGIGLCALFVILVATLIQAGYEARYSAQYARHHGSLN